MLDFETKCCKCIGPGMRTQGCGCACHDREQPTRDATKHGPLVVIALAQAVQAHHGGNRTFGRVLCAAIEQQHRTIQQMIINVLVACIVQYAKLEPWQIDQRNQFAHEVCRFIEAHLPPQYEGNFPLY